MKALFRWLVLLCAVASSPAGRAADTAPADSSAAADYAALQAMIARLRTRDSQPATTRDEALAALEAPCQQARAAGRAFFAAHPHDPLRWSVLMELFRILPIFLTPAEPGKPRTIDRAAAAAWKEELETLTTAALASSDLSRVLRAELEWRRFMATVEAGASRATPDVWAAWTREFETFLDRPTQAAVIRANGFLHVMDQVQTGLAREAWQRLAASTDADLRFEAERRLASYAKRDASVDFSYTAIDGRPVDMRQLRGKVVLLDFWATWCKPCVAELPGIQRAYEAYHDQGFEVIGISLDAPKDRAKLVAFLEKHPHPWPQLHDEANQRHPLVAQFRVAEIPALFLIDQQGKIAATGVRGERLEAELKRLLSR